MLVKRHEYVICYALWTCGTGTVLAREICPVNTPILINLSIITTQRIHILGFSSATCDKNDLLKTKSTSPRYYKL